jgi:signal transduction histidine kinase
VGQRRADAHHGRGRRGRDTAAAEAAYPDAVTTVPSRSALSIAALQLLADDATAAELDARFAEVGAGLRTGLADALIDDLLGLGLARIARIDAGVRHVVPTSLGVRVREAGFGPDTSIGLEELESLRTDLLSTIAHELRTPLTAIRTSAGLLADPATAPDEEQSRALLSSIERNAARMQRLVGDILDLARFRSGSIRLQLRRFDVCELARGVIDAVAPLASSRGQRLVLRGCEMEASVFGDHRRLEQALLNLLSNAQRFSPDGEVIEVAIDVRDGVVRWSVTDRGPGIPDTDRARLFERFFVGRTDRHAVREGVGLGLPTALAIAQAHGGTIDVDTEMGRGSTFTLVVPVDGPHDHD